MADRSHDLPGSESTIGDGTRKPLTDLAASPRVRRKIHQLTLPHTDEAVHVFTQHNVIDQFDVEQVTGHH